MKKDLTARRQLAEANFNKLSEEKKQHEEKINELDTELIRLQGEYRLLGELLEEDSSDVSPTPEVIDVNKALKGKK